jgi:hypothetical protein
MAHGLSSGDEHFEDDNPWLIGGIDTHRIGILLIDIATPAGEETTLIERFPFGIQVFVEIRGRFHAGLVLQGYLQGSILDLRWECQLRRECL